MRVNNNLGCKSEISEVAIMKLWLDDIRPAPEGWTWARSVDEAIYIMLYQGRSRDFPNISNFEACSLDHDLGEGDERDGIVFVDWMVKTKCWPNTKPVVHSMNPVGRQRMQQTIERYWPNA